MADDWRRNLVGKAQRPANRYAIVTSSALIGGHEMQLVHLARALASKHAVVMVVNSPAAEQFFVDHGFTVRLVPFSRQGKIWRQWLAARPLSHVLAPAIADCDRMLVSGGTIEACVASARALKLIRPGMPVTAYMPMYVDREQAYGLTGRIYNCVSRLFVKAIDSFITINRIQARLIGHHYGRSVSVVRNVIIPISAPSADHGPRLISVGRLDDGQKNVTGLIALLDHPDNPYRVLHIFGDGPDRPAVEAAAAAARHLRVVLHGWTPHDRLGSELGQRDLLVMNSRWEGEPMIVRELKAAGIAAIGTNIDGFRGILPRTDRFDDQQSLIAILKRHHARSDTSYTEVSEREPS